MGTTITDALQGALPDALLEVFPELRDSKNPPEARADCSQCVMLPPTLEAGHRWGFNPETRCCTYHPQLPNYLVGRALASDDTGAARIKSRLESLEGVSVWGIREPEDWQAGAIMDYFGHDASLQCPYWVGGEKSCGIWQHRTGVCRTWFCKYEHGRRSQSAWRALTDILSRIEDGIAELLVSTGAPPSSLLAAESQDTDEHADEHTDESERAAEAETWFRACASRVETLSAADLAPVRDALASDLVERWQRLAAQSRPPLANAPVPVVSDGFGDGDGIAVEGYSPYDGVRGPAELLDFFAALDGQRSWREALDHAGFSESDESDESGSALVQKLYQADILVDPETRAKPAAPIEPMPRVLEPSVERPILIGDRVWLRGSSPVASLVAPRVIFEFFALLDGERSWRDALAEVDAIDEDLVRALYAIGALGTPGP